MRRCAVFATWTVTGLALLTAVPKVSQAQDPSKTPPPPKVEPLPPVAAPPATPPAVVHPAPVPPRTVTVVPGPAVVPGPVVVPAPAVVPAPVVVPGTFIPPAYPSGLISPYNPLSGPPYAMPVFPEAVVVPLVQPGVQPGVQPTVSVTYVAGRTSQISITAPAGQTFPADVRVQSVTDPAHSIIWEVKSASVSPDRRTLNVTIEGKGLPKSTTKGPESGSLTFTLTGTGTLPTVQPVPVVYVIPQ